MPPNVHMLRSTSVEDPLELRCRPDDGKACRGLRCGFESSVRVGSLCCRVLDASVYTQQHRERPPHPAQAPHGAPRRAKVLHEDERLNVNLRQGSQRRIME